MRLVIERTRGSVRLALAQRRGTRTRLLALQAVPADPLEAGASAVRGFLDAAKVNPDEVVVAIPREHILTRTVKFPATDRRELSQMVELYAKAQLPYPRAQTVVAHASLAEQEGFSTVMVAACQQEVMARHLAAAREAGLAPTMVTVSAWGVLGWARAVLRAGRSPEPVLILHVDETRADLVLVEGPRVLSSRSVGQGVQDWQDPREIPELLAAEIERSRATIRKELPAIEIRSLVLTGVGPLGDWAEELTRRTGLAVSIHDPWPSLPLAERARTPASSCSPVVAGGLAISAFHDWLDISPPEVRSHARHRRQVRELALVSGLLLGVLMLGAASLAVQASRRRRMADQLQHALARVAPAARELQDKSRSVQMVSAAAQDRRRLAETLSGIFRQTPATVTLEGVLMDRGRREITVKGSAVSTQAVLDYLKALERLEGIRNGELKYSTRRSGASEERTSFELILHQETAS